MSPTTTTTQTLELALTELPAKLRVHELAKRAGLTSKEVLAALSAAGIKASSAASSVSADDATAVLTTLLGADDSAPAPDPVAAEPAPAAEPEASPAGSDRPAAPAAADPGFFAAPLFLPPAEAKPARRRRGAKAAAEPPTDDQPALPQPAAADGAAESADARPTDAEVVPEPAPDAAENGDAEIGTSRSGRRRRGRSGSRGRGGHTEEAVAESSAPTDELTAPSDDHSDQLAAVLPPDGAPVVELEEDDEDGDQARRRRRRGRRGRGRAGDEAVDESTDSADSSEGLAESTGNALPTDAAPTVEHDGEDESGEDESGDEESGDEGGTRRRRRRRRRSGSAEPVSEDSTGEDDPDNTVVHVREPRPPRESNSPASDVQGIRGSTRLEAKRQRRRDSRGDRKRPQILTEAEFLARREAVDRVMAVRQRGDLAQVALLEDGILVEHFVSRAGSESLMGNIYLGRVQNVLPSMEAAFVDIGKGRNAVLYAGEVNWDAAGLAGKARRIETALSGGDTILVQVSKDPVGQKGARLTTQISLPGRFLVYVPGGGATGISRKLPDTERKRLKSILDRIVPEDAGVIIRTAAEGVAEEELARDVDRLKSQWEAISEQARKKGNAPLQLSAEPDTLIKVIRDLFNSDISRLVLDGDRAYEPVAAYVSAVAPELADRVSRYDGPNDVFTAYRIDEQIAKALERKVYLPSGGSLVIDRTEAMTVVDVNTGKYTGSGGNLEETVTRNNLEAAEEVVRQLRLRDIGGIIVVDFIDMVLESNRELVMRRLTECLGRDRTRHQVAEVTSLGLIQMTRKKMGTGLVEAFSEPCPHCQGRGILLHDVPMEDRSSSQDEDPNRGRRRGKGRQESAAEPEPIVKQLAAAVRPPDPRGPKPPTRSNGELSHEADQVVSRPAGSDQAGSDQAGSDSRADRAAAGTQPASTPSAAGRGVAAEAGTSASFNAPRSRDASDAVSAVLAALDAQATRQADQLASGGSAADAAVAPADAAPAGGRRRGRRAAGRPAGAPNAAVPADVPVPDEVPAAAVPDDVPVAVADEQPAAAPDAPVSAVVDAEVVDAEVVDVLDVLDAEVAEVATAEVPQEPVRAARPPRRRAGRPAGAAVPAAEASPAGEISATSVPTPADPAPADPAAADTTIAEPTAVGAYLRSAGNGSAPDATAPNGQVTKQNSGHGTNGSDGAGNGGVEVPVKAAPRRRRAASRPAGPAGAAVPQ